MNLDRPTARALSPSAVEIDGETYFVISDPAGLAPEGLALPLPVFAVLALCNGENTSEDIQARLVMESGRFIAFADVAAILAELERHDLLRTPATQRRLLERVDAYRAAPRPATHAGAVYPEDAAELAAYLDALLASAPEPSVSVGARALIAPHIDYGRGAEAYAAAYRAAGEALAADAFIVLGTAHAPVEGAFILTRQAYETPLGPLEVDEECASRIEEAVGAPSPADELLHLGEHSVEFQAVFLKHLFPQARIAPVLCSHLDAEAGALRAADALADALRALLSRDDRRVALVAGVDLTHVGPAFGHDGTLSAAVREWASDVDRQVLDACLRGDAVAVLEACETLGPSGEDPNVCGQAALYVLAKTLGPCSGRVLTRATAPTPDGASQVGFGAALAGLD